MAKFKKGQSGNPKGKPRGAINKITEDLRAAISEFLKSNFSQVQEDFNRLSPRDRMGFFLKLIEYDLPKRRSIDSSEELKIQLDGLTEDQLEEIVNRITKNKNDD